VVRLSPQYWLELLTEMGMKDCRSVRTPAELKVDSAGSTELLGRDEHAAFRRVVGKAMYASAVRPDIMYVSKELARCLAAPTSRDWVRAKRLLRYLAGTTDFVLTLTGHTVGSEEPQAVQVFADANWAAGESRRSTSGGCAFYRGVLLSTWSRTQPTITLSTAESELLALGTAAQEGQLVAHILAELGQSAPLRLHTDSTSARAAVNRRGVGRMKHLAVKQLWLQEGLRAGEFTIQKVPSLENLADFMTKTFTAARHEVLCQAIGLRVWTD